MGCGRRRGSARVRDCGCWVLPAAEQSVADLGRFLHERHFPITTDQTIIFLKSITLLGPKSIGDIYWAARATLAELETEGRRLAVLGEMAELGNECERGHREVGEAAATLKIDELIAIGKTAGIIADAAREAGLEKSRTVASAEEAAEILAEETSPND